MAAYGPMSGWQTASPLFSRRLAKSSDFKPISGLAVVNKRLALEVAVYVPSACSLATKNLCCAQKQSDNELGLIRAASKGHFQVRFQSDLHVVNLA